MSRPVVVEDSYEAAALDVAWAEWRDANPTRNSPAGYEAFRAGYRRGIGQGALLAATTFVHSDDQTGEEV